jgi:3-mercaptopyruvate sulfurtransferase SseA
LSHEDEIIRASEIGQYAFCARAWWYSRVKGHVPENVVELEQGVMQHRRHGRQVQVYHQLRRIGLGLLLLAGLVLLAWLLLSLGG